MRDYRDLPQCRDTGKLMHPDYHSAARHLKFEAKRSREPVRRFKAYVCRHCQHWHIGHRRKARVQS
jgi:hypothetical protein